MGNNQLYKGYVETKGKKPTEKLKGRTKWKKYDEVKDCPGYGGVLADDTVLIDIDDSDEAEKMLNIVEANQLDCRVYQTTRGKHFLFKNNGMFTRNRTRVTLAVGLTADIKIGSRLSYEVIKINGEERFIEWDIDEGGSYQKAPKYFIPVNANAEFLDMESGDGRNQALFNYILKLQATDMNIDEIRETITLINQYVLAEPLPDAELETVLRDEAFQKPVFFNGSAFLFERFAAYLKNNCHVVNIYNRLHVYSEGVYVPGNRALERTMIELIPNLKRNQRKEVLDLLPLIAEDVTPADARYISFNNGIYDLTENELKPFSPEIVVTNKIPWNYRTLFDEGETKDVEAALNQWSCDDQSIRALIEECVGYCMYRENIFNKAFFLTGEKSNGKSTFLKVLKSVLGESNITALDLNELGNRFDTALLFGKLANIGDDIDDGYIPNTALFKKITDGGLIKGENKGETAFEFNPYCKLIFSANDMPRMKDKTGAVKRRLVIIPFNATFEKGADGFDAHILDKLTTADSIEYLIMLAVNSLNRVLAEQGFTKSVLSQKAADEYEAMNNPILGFIEDHGEKNIIYQPTKDVFVAYQKYCSDNGFMSGSKIGFSRGVCRALNLITKQKKINNDKFQIFAPVSVQD